jgi:acetaldehyde dehydrogenase/alcohol dehydrogenase
MTYNNWCNTLGSVRTLDDLDALTAKVGSAQRDFATFSQSDVDKIFKAAAIAAKKKASELAEMAVTETGMGVVKDKITKNKFASEFIYNRYKNEKTCGVIFKNQKNGIRIVADPIGVIAGVVPTTNPTSTAIFKTLISLKTRNGIIVSPHPRAKKCTVEASKIVLEAALEAGAPCNIIGWLDEPTMELSNALMQHRATHIVLATGGPGMVKAAYSSGKPALGVGSGNTPAVIDETANVRAAVSAVISSKTFDNGMICASEQSIVAVSDVYGEVKEVLLELGAHILSKKESIAVGKVILTDKGINANIVGQPPSVIANLAGIDIPGGTTVLVSEETSCGTENPYAHEKLSPILALYESDNFVGAVEIALKLVSIGGLGHTAVLHTNALDEWRVDHFAVKMPTGRVLINVPASHAAIGLCNNQVTPSLTLGCGSWGGNSVSENIGVKHLLNYKMVVEERSRAGKSRHK